MSKEDVLSNYGNAMPSFSFMGAPPNGATALMEHCYMDRQGQHEIPREISTVSLNREIPNGTTKPKEPNYPNGHAYHEIPSDEPLLKFTREPPKKTKDQNGHVKFVTPRMTKLNEEHCYMDGHDQHEIPRSRVKECLKKPMTSIVISFVSIGMCITSILLVVTSPLNEQPRNLTCVECAVLNRTDNSGTTLRQMLKTVYQDGKELCCAENNQQLSALISFSMKDQTAMPATSAIEKNVNITPYSISNASMHMKLVPSHDDKEKYFEVPQFHPTNFDLNFEPDEHNPLLEHRRNVEVSSEGVTIQVPGLYLVYVSVHFRPESAKPCKMFDKQTWSMNVLRSRVNNPTPDTILTATHTCCDECTHIQETGFTAGVFVLRADDVIKVDVSGERLVSYLSQSTYFGLTMLGTIT